MGYHEEAKQYDKIINKQIGFVTSSEGKTLVWVASTSGIGDIDTWILEDIAPLTSSALEKGGPEELTFRTAGDDVELIGPTPELNDDVKDTVENIEAFIVGLVLARAVERVTQHKAYSEELPVDADLFV